jgi:cell fate regulator YaaT (PSP1 superfamily)
MDLIVVGIRFKKAGKIYYFDPGDLPEQWERE